MNNQHEVTINAVELASILAEEELNDNHGDYMQIYVDDDEDTTYTDQAQKMFDELYDYYMELINGTKVKQHEQSTSVQLHTTARAQAQNG